MDCSDEWLMCRFCETLDDGVFRALADRYYDRALRTAQGQLCDGALAHDAVQEAFLRVVRHRRRYRPDRPFAPWFFTILRNVCTDLRRKEARHVQALRRLAELARPEPTDGNAAARAATLLDSLGENDVQLLRFRYVHGMSASEIAGAIGCTIEAAKKRIQRILRRLQSCSPALDPT